ncbi:MAG: DNA methyltransferase [Nitrospirota bacterium]
MELLEKGFVQKSKKYTPGGLPFLQVQILEQIYLDISQNKKTEIKKLSEVTGYPPTSKILLSAIDSLIKKKFLNNSLNNGFSVPMDRFNLFERIINMHDYQNKNYSTKLFEHLEKKSSQLELFLEAKTVSELNQFGVIHRWYNLLEEFPYSLIEKKIIEYKLQNSSLVVDPFCGSGTTLVSANLFHLNAIGFDANPLMTFVSTVKTTYDIECNELERWIKKVAEQFLLEVKNIDKIKFTNGFLKSMPERELNQWLSPRLQKEVYLLKDIISQVCDPKIKNLLLLAMAKSCFDASYVSLCPGTTFYPFREKMEFWDLFTDKVIQMHEDLKAIQKHNNYGRSKLIADTCLNAHKYLKPDTIDLMITSPPYPNDLEYTRQTRLELYLLDFVKDMDDVQKIKRNMVKGSTKLIFKESNSASFVEKFPEIIGCSERIYEKTKNKNWGFDYPRMVKEYFGDMYLCLKEFYRLMKPQSHFLLVVGDQTIKGVLIPVGDILITIAKEIGYKYCCKELFRIRRSTGHSIPLPEEIVILKK